MTGGRCRWFIYVRLVTLSIQIVSTKKHIVQKMYYKQQKQCCSHWADSSSLASPVVLVDHSRYVGNQYTRLREDVPSSGQVSGISSEWSSPQRSSNIEQQRRWLIVVSSFRRLHSIVSRHSLSFTDAGSRTLTGRERSIRKICMFPSRPRSMLIVQRAI